MTGIWIASFALLSFLVLIETGLLLALTRHVGVLSTRIKPVAGLEDEEAGPSAGTVLQMLELEHAAGPAHRRPFQADRSFLFFVSPTCALCRPLIKPLERLQSDHPSINFALVSDVASDRAREYAERVGTKLPVFVANDALSRWRVQGTPYALVAAPDGTILAAGLTNTLEQLEILVERSESPRLAAANGAPSPGLELELTSVEEGKEVLPR